MSAILFPPSPYQNFHGILYLPRMLEKIRLHANGKLGNDYIPNLGKGFDEDCVAFLSIDYQELVNYVVGGATNQEVWEWIEAEVGIPSEYEVKVWNSYLKKAGWRDELSAKLEERLNEAGAGERTDIQTFFDFLDFDEGRLC